MKYHYILYIIIIYLLLYINLSIFIINSFKYCLLIDIFALFYIIKRTLTLRYLIDLELHEVENFMNFLSYIKTKMEAKMNLEQALLSFISTREINEELYTILILSLIHI